MADANINPIPIHTPTGLGGTSDLLTITRSEIVSFRMWSNDYVTKLQAAQVETGTSPYRTINGFQCHNPIYEMDANAENKDSACGQFLQLLGFTDENFSELAEIWDEDVVEHIHYKWIPQYKFSEYDFAFFLDLIEKEMIGVSKTVVSHSINKYHDEFFPDEAARVAMSMQDTSFDIEQRDDYHLDEGSDYPPEPDHIGWDPSGVEGRDKIKKSSLYYGIDSIKFYDDLGAELIKDSWLYPAIMSLFTVSLNQAITTVSLIKTGETQELTGGIDPDFTYSYTVHADEEISINYTLVEYDRYYIGDEEEDYRVYDPYGYYTNAYAPYYVNLFWDTRTYVVNAYDPVNNEIGMYEYYDGEYFLRVNFQYFASPDELSYMISAFSYVEIEEEEKKGGLIRGIIGIVLFVAGAWLFYHGATTASEFLWRMGAAALGMTAKHLYQDKLTAEYNEMMIAKNDLAAITAQEAKEDAFRDNRTDLSFTPDYYDKIEPINPYAEGLFLPLNSCTSGSSMYSVGGEYWEPQTKLVNQRDIL